MLAILHKQAAVEGAEHCPHFLLADVIVVNEHGLDRLARFFGLPGSGCEILLSEALGGDKFVLATGGASRRLDLLVEGFDEGGFGQHLLFD